MHFIPYVRQMAIGEVPENQFVVVHPLDDVPEEKVDIASLGPMPMTRTVRFSLMALRGYLVVMGLLVAYHVIDLAGVLGSRGH